MKWGPLAKGDILDRGRLEEVFQQYKPSAVMHFAAYADVGESVAEPLKYYRNNVSGTLNLLEVMRNLDVDRIVFSSTCATYGLPQTISISEEHPQVPINPYGFSKLVCEQMLSDLDVAYDLRSMSLRYFNAAGADPDGEIGEERSSDGHLIPAGLADSHGQPPPRYDFRTDYDTPDGTCVRDYIHVTDLAEAHVLALKALQSNSELCELQSRDRQRVFSQRRDPNCERGHGTQYSSLNRGPAGREILRGWRQMRPGPKASSGGSRSITS